MKRFFWILPCCLFGTGLASAQPPQAGPVPPALYLVREAKAAEGKILLRSIVPVCVAEETQEKVVQDGMEITVKRIQYRTVFVERVLMCEAKKSQFMLADGTKVAAEEVWRRLKPNAVVVASSDGKTPAAEYLRALSPETLVIIPPFVESAAPGPLPKPLDKKIPEEVAPPAPKKG